MLTTVMPFRVSLFCHLGFGFLIYLFIYLFIFYIVRLAFWDATGFIITVAIALYPSFSLSSLGLLIFPSICRRCPCQTGLDQSKHQEPAVCIQAPQINAGLVLKLPMISSCCTLVAKCLKGTVQAKMKILSFTHSHVVTNLSCVEHKRRYFEKGLCVFICLYNESQ